MRLYSPTLITLTAVTCVCSILLVCKTHASEGSDSPAATELSLENKREGVDSRASETQRAMVRARLKLLANEAQKAKRRSFLLEKINASADDVPEGVSLQAWDFASSFCQTISLPKDLGRIEKARLREFCDTDGIPIALFDKNFGNATAEKARAFNAGTISPATRTNKMSALEFAAFCASNSNLNISQNYQRITLSRLGRTVGGWKYDEPALFTTKAQKQQDSHLAKEIELNAFASHEDCLRLRINQCSLVSNDAEAFELKLKRIESSDSRACVLAAFERNRIPALESESNLIVNYTAEIVTKKHLITIAPNGKTAKHDSHGFSLELKDALHSADATKCLDRFGVNSLDESYSCKVVKIVNNKVKKHTLNRILAEALDTEGNLLHGVNTATISDNTGSTLEIVFFSDSHRFSSTPLVLLVGSYGLQEKSVIVPVALIEKSIHEDRQANRRESEIE